jgi:cystathionine gamma-synthase
MMGGVTQPTPLHFETRAVTGGRPPARPDEPLNVPVTLASTYIAGGELEYGRYANPSWTAFEEVLGDLEGGRCLAFASGMAASAAVLDLLDAGSRVVAPRHSYTGTIGLLREAEQRGRLSAEFVDITDTAAVGRAAEGAALVWIESPTNPAL